MPAIFNKSNYLNTIHQLYYQKLDSLSIVHEIMEIESSFGKTNVIITGPQEKPPLVILHGVNSNAPIALEMFKNLINDYRIYAIDLLGQANLSDPHQLRLEDDSYGKWLFEILSRLNIWNVNLVGFSLGGFIAWKALSFDPKRLAKVILINPGGIVNGKLISIFWKLQLPIFLYKKLKSPVFIYWFLSNFYTLKDTFAYTFLKNALPVYHFDSAPFPLITKELAQNICIPIYIIASDKDWLFPGNSLLKRAKDIFPTLEKSLLLKNTKHMPDLNGLKRIHNFIQKNLKEPNANT